MSNNNDDVLDAARRAFAALEKGQWDRLIELIDPEQLAELREHELAKLIAWAHHRPDLAMRSGGSASYSSDGTINPALLTQHADFLFPAFPGEPTLGALAAMSVRDFVSAWLSASFDGPFGDHDVPGEYLGVVDDGNTFAHVVYRPSGAFRYPWHIEVLSLRRATDGRWLVVSTDELLKRGGLMFKLMMPDGLPQPGE